MKKTKVLSAIAIVLTLTCVFMLGCEESQESQAQPLTMKDVLCSCRWGYEYSTTKGTCAYVYSFYSDNTAKLEWISWDGSSVYHSATYVITEAGIIVRGATPEYKNEPVLTNIAYTFENGNLMLTDRKTYNHETMHKWDE